ncbi:fas-associated death domain protein [Tachypleus tridentatus]|uniref:fas-associated death domain protein n=1 Tax=Tachypleus tridentatus TaxID=6853 RepID=UPI003FD036CC
MTAALSPYENLKSKVWKNIELICVDDGIREAFRQESESWRALKEVTSMKELIQLLEDRDILTEWNVAVLEKLVKLLGDKESVNLIKAYKKLELSDTTPRCCVCHCEIKITPIQLDPVLDSENDSDEMESAMLYISRNYGSRWKHLARALKVREGDIDSVICDYPGDTCEQIYQALCRWKEEHASRANMDVLLETLRKSSCKRNDLAEKLQNGYHLH